MVPSQGLSSPSKALDPELCRGETSHSRGTRAQVMVTSTLMWLWVKITESK